MEDRIRELLERQAVVDVLHRYCWCVDHGEVERLLVEVYTPDAVDDHGDGGVARGRDELRRMFTGLQRWSAGHVHVLSNVQVEVEGPEATASSTFTAYHWLREHGDRAGGGRSQRPADLVSVGTYEDRLRRTPDGWRIVARRVTTTAPSFVAAGAMPGALRDAAPTDRGARP